MGSAAVTARRYANALFASALEEQALERVANDIKNLQALLAGSTDLLSTLSNKAVAGDHLENSLIEITKKLKCHLMTQNFLRMLIRSHRINLLTTIFSEFHKLLALKRGELTAKVTTVRKLNATQISRLTKALSKISGCKIVPEFDVDSDIIGGVIINAGSYQMDASLRTQLNELKNELRLS